LNQRQSLTLAIHALTVAKDNDPHCGGESEIRILLNDGTITPPAIWGQKPWKDSAEETLREFDGDVRKLLLAITDPAGAHGSAVNYFADRMQYIRERWMAFIRGAETYAARDPDAPHGLVIHSPLDLPPEDGPAEESE